MLLLERLKSLKGTNDYAAAAKYYIYCRNYRYDCLCLLRRHGGGTEAAMLRDLMIGNIPPNMFRNPVYVLAAFLTVLVLFLLFRCWPFLLGSRYIEGYEKIMNILDAIGLGAFTVIGIDTGVEAGYGDYHFLIIFLGVITGIGGGILRDIMAGETPYVLKKHIYACASIAGACLYVVLLQVTRSDSAMIGSALLVVAIRILASHFRWDLPGIDMD